QQPVHLGMLRHRHDERAQIIEHFTEEIGGVLHYRAIFYHRLVKFAFFTTLARQGKSGWVVVGRGGVWTRRCGRWSRLSSGGHRVRAGGTLFAKFGERARARLEGLES